MKKIRYKTAVGLGYKPGCEGAPTIEVKGGQAEADLIVKTARRYGVPVVENGELARALNSVELDREIPENLFEAVALILGRIEMKLGLRGNPRR